MVRRKSGFGVIRRVKATSKAIKQLAIAVEKVGDVKLLGHSESRSWTITFDTYLKDPVKFALVLGGMTAAEVGHEVGAKRRVIIDDDAVVDPKNEPKKRRRAGIGKQASINGRLEETIAVESRREKLNPLASGLAKAVKAAAKLDD